MTIWTSKAASAALLLIGLAGCDILPQPPTDAEPVALSKAKMAFGTVTLVPPRGYCIDQRSLRQNFAMMARCDRLGAPSQAEDAPIGIITASFTAHRGSLPSPLDTAAALDLASVTDTVETDAGVTFRARGSAPAEGLSDTHWRGTAVVGSQIMGLALYSAAGGQATGREGRQILSSIMVASSPGSDG